jgi:hypothetical protein
MSAKKSFLFSLVLLQLIANRTIANNITISFEEFFGLDQSPIGTFYPGIRFEAASSGQDWIASDVTTGIYNASSWPTGQSWGTGEYWMYDYVSAWTGIPGDDGKISFDQGAKFVELGYSAYSTFSIRAYDSSGNLLDSNSGPPNLRYTNNNPNGPGTLRVDWNGTVPISYILIGDSGNYWLVDNISVGLPPCWVELSKVDDVNDDDCVGPGDEITYTIDYNYPAGPNCTDINDVNIIDYLPGEVEFMSASGGGTYDSNSHTVIWNIGTLETNESGSVKLTVKVKGYFSKCGVITNSCKIKSGSQTLVGAYENTPVCRASNPKPGCGATAALYVGEALDINLVWCPGFFAADVNGQDVYFGTNFSDVNNAVNSTPVIYKGRQSATTYTARNLLLQQTYFWRVDEVNMAGPDPCIWPGPVWSFTTGLFIDDFEHYASSADFGLVWHTDVFNEWESGYCSEIMYFSTGASINLDVLNQSMIYDYNNRSGSPEMSGSALFSEARMESKVSGIDWTVGESNILSISYRGLADNNTDPIYDRMYVAIIDAAGNMGPVVYNPDATAQNTTTWHEWQIPFSDLKGATSLELTKEVNLIIGFGVRCNPMWVFGGTPGGTGRVWFDNIRLKRSRCTLNADFTDDCIVDFRDFAVLAEEWLRCGQADIYPDCNVNLMDFAILAQEWLEDGP